MSAAARLCGSRRLRCFFRDRIVSVSLDDIGGARTAIDERAHVGPAVRDSLTNAACR